MGVRDLSGAEGVSVRYPRKATGTKVALIPDIDLRGARSLAVSLRSVVPTQLKIYAIMPGGETRMRYVVLSPASMSRRLRLSLDSFDPEPSAAWSKVPERGALLIADVPQLRRISPRGELHISSLSVSSADVPLSSDLVPKQRLGLDPDHVYAAWLGKVLGGRAGMAGEGSGEPNWTALAGKDWRDLAPSDEFGFGPDDDTTLGVGSLLLAHRLARPPTGAEIAMEWMTRISPEVQWKNGWEVLRRFRAGLRAPETGRGPRGQCLDARIRATPWGLLAIGDPARADAMALEDAALSSYGAGLDDARFVARLLSGAPKGGLLEGQVRAAVRGLGSAYRAAILLGFRTKTQQRALKDAYGEVREKYYRPLIARSSEDAWVHSLPNAGLLGVALAYGEGEPMKTLRLASFLGWDSDCNAGTVGAFLGAWKGLEAFPSGFRVTLSDRLRVAIAGREHWSIRRLAEVTGEAAQMLEKAKLQ